MESATATTSPRRGFAGRAMRLVVGYWFSEERRRAWVLLGVIVALTLGLVFLLVQLNEWNRVFYEAIQNKDLASFWPLVLRFCELAAVYITGAVLKVYFTQMLEMRWRVWLTKRFVGDWLDGQAYYRIALGDHATDNPDQRIAEDLQLFTSNTLDLSLGLLSSVVTLVSFVFILWEISGPITLPLGGAGLTIPGYMVWAALVYSLLGSLITHWLGRPLIGLNFLQQRLEADFRFSLVRVRENAEGIALYRGEPFERTSLLDRFERIRQNWWRLMHTTLRMGVFTVGFAQVANVFPLLVAAPRYFAGEISLGVLFQIAQAFGQVQDSLSWIVENYGALASWRATTDRLLTFQDALAAAKVQPLDGGRVEVVADGAQGLTVDDLDVALPSGRPLLADVNLRVMPGEQVLLTGPNGTGKSTLFRAIAGIWPFGRGRVELPAKARTLFLPQRPYIPVAPLRDAVTYPAPPGTFADEQIRDALRAVGLERFGDRLDESQNWSLQMSGGEQQRLAFARALLHRPDFLFLDEATAALDEAGEREVYRQLRERLPATTVVSIGHGAHVVAADGEGIRLTVAPPENGGPAHIVEAGSATPR